MKYIVFPIDKLNSVPQEELDKYHLAPRTSVDGAQVIMKVANYEKLFPADSQSVLAEGDEVNLPYQTYEGDALDTLLAEYPWVKQEDEAPIIEPVLLSAEEPKTTVSRKSKSKKSTVL